MLILDEDVIERSESKPDRERAIAGNVKDAMRVESVPQLL
jgi:hypothetical protein